MEFEPQVLPSVEVRKTRGASRVAWASVAKVERGDSRERVCFKCCSAGSLPLVSFSLLTVFFIALELLVLNQYFDSTPNP